MGSITKLNVKPFLRWAGGKQWLASRLAVLIPEYDHAYYEPFLGGGSLFFAARPKRAILSDINERLICTYIALRDQPKDVISILSQWRNDVKTYYEIRETEFEDNVWQSAQLIYLNKTCWNGLYRVNRQGKFNVPFGYHKRKVCNEEHLLEVSEMLQNTEIICCDFQQSLNTTKAGDFVYLDPPYTTLHSNNSFRNYNENLFSWEAQIRLADTAHKLSRRGCLVVVSNAANQEIQDLYQDFYYQKVTRHSVLAANPKWRQKTEESLFASSDRILLERLNLKDGSSND